MSTSYTTFIASGYGTIGYQEYAINLSGNVTQPVYANSTSTRNIPLTYIGNTITDLWPYGNGSAVANAVPPGYNFSSTGAFTPGTAALLYIPDSTTSYNNYYKLVSTSANTSTWENSYKTEVILTIECYSNVSANIQLTPFVSTTSNTSLNILNTQYQSGYVIKPFPEQTSITQVVYNDFDNTISNVGFYIRNYTASTQVTVSSAQLVVRQVLTN